ncbi:MAG: DUF4124 domain-containing protein [Gammaproteobacteria bacterium]|nr:DUF4124 domain-containing protein [Gammaproteobacteria bacterium]MDH3821520.1 DUF4124 domain-containing protein [Gammaproteobacteria bacterium]MDH3990627.1 DUF4124 domain-containing protein [Gammaproteobacteria bacterium]
MVKSTKFLVAIGVMLTAACAITHAQQTVYKWVDEDGVIQFSDEPPKVSPDIKVEMITTDPAPHQSAAPRSQATVRSNPRTKTQVESESMQPQTQMPPLVEQVDVKKMSLEELDHRCEDARENMIAPLRAAEIKKCIQTGTGDQAWCKSFWADYGASSRTPSGEFIPGMFYDLPECTEAWEERNYRGLYPGRDR